MWRVGSDGSSKGWFWAWAPEQRVPSYLRDRTRMGLVLIELFLQRQWVLHGTDGPHRGAHKHHAAGVRDDDGCVDDVKC